MFQKSMKIATQSVTVSLSAQQVFFWDVSRSSIRVFFRFCQCCRLACCNLSWLHTRWSIICAPWSVLFGKGKRCDLCIQDTQIYLFFTVVSPPLRDQSQIPPWCYHAAPQERVQGRTVELVLDWWRGRLFDHEAVSTLESWDYQQEHGHLERSEGIGHGTLNRTCCTFTDRPLAFLLGPLQIV